MKSGDRRRFFAAYEEGGLIEGFVDFRRVESSSPRERAVEVELLLTTSPHAYEALASFLLGIDLALTLRMDHRPPDEPLRHLLADPRRLRATRVVDDLWLRPLDVRAALEGRRYVPGGPDHLTIEVHDPLFPENEGRYELAVDADGGVSVSGPAPAVAGRAALELDVGVLGSVLLGGRRLAPLVPAGDVVEHEARAAWRADAMFLADREPFATISF
jgi:predicted acetyltransferase